jgi:hypothetical protein
MNTFGDEPSLLDENLTGFLHSFAEERGFSINAHNAAFSLREIIRIIFRNSADIPLITESTTISDGLVADQRRIIVLIDEYDAPIINNIIDTKKMEITKQTLHGFYNSLKSCENMIDRVFITGITKFAQLSVFSAMNNLIDISFESKYATICGFTVDEIIKYYPIHLDTILTEFQDVKMFGQNFTSNLLMKRITDYYDGYSWNGDDRVLNPFSLQFFLLKHIFDNYWFRSGGMNFLDQINIRDDVFSKVFKEEQDFNGSVDVQDAGNSDPVALMLQAGYLTVRKRQVSEKISELYLAVPNKEVSMAIVRNFVETRVIPSLLSDDDNFTPELCREFCSVFCQGQLDRAEVLLQSFLSSIPNTLHEETESLYHVFLFTIFRMSNFKTLPERSTGRGIADLVIRTPELGYIVAEMKYAKSDSTSTDSPVVSDSPPGTVISAKDNRKLDSCIKAAFKQIIKKEYLLPYLGNPKPVHAVAIAVCGRNHVRIKSLPAEELLRRSHEFLKFREDQSD